MKAHRWQPTEAGRRCVYCEVEQSTYQTAAGISHTVWYEADGICLRVQPRCVDRDARALAAELDRLERTARSREARLQPHRLATEWRHVEVLDWLTESERAEWARLHRLMPRRPSRDEARRRVAARRARRMGER